MSSAAGFRPLELGRGDDDAWCWQLGTADPWGGDLVSAGNPQPCGMALAGGARWRGERRDETGRTGRGETRPGGLNQQRESGRGERQRIGLLSRGPMSVGVGVWGVLVK